VAFRLESVKDQAGALKRIADLIAKGCVSPTVVRAARAITSECASRDDLCELEAIYDAVKNGTDVVPGMKRGLRYVADPTTADWYQGAAATLKECASGACAGDCDEHTVLVASLAGALGFKVGARAWGSDPNRREYQHVYAVVAYPKKGPWNKDRGSVRGMDTTVEEAHVGWEPPRGAVLTYWIEPS
jgi:hypothetical protein